MTRREFLIATGATALAAPAPVSSLAFAGVPASSRLRMHWWVLGTAWTKEESERQLQSMANAHVGSVLIFPAHPYEVNNPSRGVHNQPYLSGEFFDVLNSVIAKARELHLILDIVAGTGWPYGGPSVTAEDSARMIQRVRIAAKQRDIELPVLKPGQTRIAVFNVSPEGFADVTPLVSPRGTLQLDGVGPGSEVQFFYSTPTGQQVKRASTGAEGHVLDHYSESATRHYLDAVGAKLLERTPAGSFRSFFCDSFEVYNANWTPLFPDLFRTKRGYDIVPLLPALFDDAHPDCRDLRYDFWRTLSELATEQFVAPLHAWGREHGIATQVEAYGAPPISLDGYQHIDIPCGEGFNWKQFTASRWAASGGRLAGKRLIATEGWTWLGFPNRFGDSMERLKVASDLQFLCGINETYGVSYSYSPSSAGAPGWPPYFGPVVNHTQPYWPYFSHLADYIARAQYLLQQGSPVTDIALYLGEEDCFADAEVAQLQFRFNKQMSLGGRESSSRFRGALDYGANVITTIACNGYSFDGVDAGIFRAGLRAAGGRLQLGDGEYRILVLPNLTSIDPDVLEAIVRFVETGGTVIATRRLPETVYGLQHREANRQKVGSLITSLFGFRERRSSLQRNIFGRGKAIFCPDEQASLLAALREVQPDIQFAEPSDYVGFQHRRLPDREIYFVANTAEAAYEADAIFRVGKMYPELWNPRSGEVARPRQVEYASTGTRVAFTLESYESQFVVFSQAPGASPVQRLGTRQNTLRGAHGIPAPLALDLRWKLRREGAEAAALDRLQSWTALPGWRYFSGRGVYEAVFQLPPEYTHIGASLDLGRVHETADVYVNGASAGLAWMRPFCVDVTKLLRPGANQLRIDVTNLLTNKVLGDGPIDYSKVNARYGNRFPAGDEWELVREPFPSGLLGPVRLVFYQLISGPGSDGKFHP